MFCFSGQHYGRLGPRVESSGARRMTVRACRAARRENTTTGVAPSGRKESDINRPTPYATLHSPAQQIECDFALDRDSAQPAGELMNHQSRRDSRSVNRAPDIQLPRSASAWVGFAPSALWKRSHPKAARIYRTEEPRPRRPQATRQRGPPTSPLIHPTTGRHSQRAPSGADPNPGGISASPRRQPMVLMGRLRSCCQSD